MISKTDCPANRETCEGCGFVKQGFCDYPYIGNVNMLEVKQELLERQNEKDRD